MDTFDLRAYLKENRLLQSINEYNFNLLPSLITEAEKNGIDAKQGVMDVSKAFGIDAKEIATSLNQISQAEKEGNDKKVKQIQQDITKKINEGTLNEISFTVGVAIASLIPKILSAAGRGANFMKRNIPGVMQPEGRKAAQEMINNISKNKNEIEKLQNAIKFATAGDAEVSSELLQKAKLIKSLPSPSDPNYAMLKPKYEKFQQVVEKYKNLQKEVQQLENTYDEKYGAFYVDFESSKKGKDGKPKRTFKGNALKTLGDKIHHLYMKPFEGILWVLGRLGWKDMRDPEKRKKAATIFYCIAMIATAGYGVISHLGAVHGIKGLAEIGTELVDGSLAQEEAAETLFRLNALSTKT